MNKTNQSILLFLLAACVVTAQEYTVGALAGGT